MRVCLCAYLQGRASRSFNKLADKMHAVEEAFSTLRNRIPLTSLRIPTTHYGGFGYAEFSPADGPSSSAALAPAPVTAPA